MPDIAAVMEPELDFFFFFCVSSNGHRTMDGEIMSVRGLSS